MQVRSGPGALDGAPAKDVFQILKDGAPKSLSELSALTGMARSTVNDRISALSSAGLIGPSTDGVSAGGRPPRRVALVADARLVLACDLGASHLRLALVNLLNEPLCHVEQTIDIGSGPEDILATVLKQADQLLAAVSRTREDVAAIGIGLPGPVHFESGRPSRPPIMPGWDGFDVPNWFRRHIDAQVLVDNDVNIMALGEHSRLKRPTDHFIFVKVATGIGAGVISGGRLQRGAQGIAGDIGHVRVRSGDGIFCHCGNEGCLEAVASGARLVSELRRAGHSEVHGSKDVVALVEAGDLAAIRAVRQAGRDLGEVLAASVSFLNPDVIAIGGRIAGAGEHLLAGVREVVFQRAMPLATSQLDIHTAKQTRDAGLLGASLLALHHALSPEALGSSAPSSP